MEKNGLVVDFSDDQEMSSPTQNRGKKNYDNSDELKKSDKFASNTIAKGFFNANDDGFDNVKNESNKNDVLKGQGNQDFFDKQEDKKKRRRKLHGQKLQPLNPVVKTEVITNLVAKQQNNKKMVSNEDDDIQQIDFGKMDFDNNSQETTQKKAKENPQLELKKNIAYDTSEKQQSIDEQKSEETSIKIDQYIKKEEEIESLKVKKVQNMVEFVINPLKQKTILKTNIIRDCSGLNHFWPEFHVYFEEDNHFLFSGKKTSSKPTSTFLFSFQKGQYDEESKCYAGKMKSSLLGNTLNIFSTGLNPSKAMEYKRVPRQLLATIVYQTNYFQGNKPRGFQVFIKRPEFDYYKDFKSVKMYQDEIPLNQLYQVPENKEKIIILQNRKPVWRQQIKGYMLNFKGRVSKASIKNFILQDKERQGVDSLLFGRVTDTKFHMDVCYPLSPQLGFAIVLSSFDSRIACQ